MISNPRHRNKIARRHFVHDTHNEVEMRSHYNACGNDFQPLSTSQLIANSTLHNYSLSNKWNMSLAQSFLVYDGTNCGFWICKASLWVINAWEMLWCPNTEYISNSLVRNLRTIAIIWHTQTCDGIIIIAEIKKSE